MINYCKYKQSIKMFFSLRLKRSKIKGNHWSIPFVLGSLEILNSQYKLSNPPQVEVPTCKLKGTTTTLVNL